MPEIIDTFDLNGSPLGAVERKQFYTECRKEYADTGKVTRKCGTINVFVLTPRGTLYLQRRAEDKSENPGMWDKTIGGHMTAGESVRHAVTREAAEELDFPVYVCEEHEGLRETARNTNLALTGVLKLIEVDHSYVSERIMRNGDNYVQPHIRYIYVGYIDGRVRFSDGETAELGVYEPDRWAEKMAANANDFTPDMHVLFERYRRHLIPLPPEAHDVRPK